MAKLYHEKFYETPYEYTSKDTDYLCSMIDTCVKLILAREYEIDNITVNLSRTEHQLSYKETKEDIDRKKELYHLKKEIEEHRQAIEQLKRQKCAFQKEIPQIGLRQLVK
jgi:hypothetical protein